jgi:hypothetical protein
LQARIIRRQGTRLLPVAKARPLLADAAALWQRAFEAAFAIGDAVCRPTWADEPPSYLTSSPVIARPISIRWISEVPSKIVKIFASRCQRSTGYSRV